MGDKLKTWHVNMLKRYFSRDTCAKSLAGSVNKEIVVEEHSDLTVMIRSNFQLLLLKKQLMTLRWVLNCPLNSVVSCRVF